MNSTRMMTGGLLIAAPMVFTAAFAGLQMVFDYPDILRFPAAEVLTRFATGGSVLGLLWYGMMISALGLIPAAVGFALLHWKTSPLAAMLSAAFGILAGLVQALGLLRWVILVPRLATKYLAPGADELERQLATSVFDAANAYLGMGVGEHLGYFFTALWTITIAIAIWNQVRWLALAAGALAIGIATGMIEPFGVPLAGTINAISFSAWALWALILGVLVLRGGRRPAEVVASQPVEGPPIDG
ncbi:MAG: DUF4386 domain-containing protein [Devosia sp.]